MSRSKRDAWSRLIVLAAGCLAAVPVFGQISYPETRRVDQVDTLHGVEVADPYRWLEDLDSADTAAWVAAQNEVTNAWLRQVPERDRIRERIEQVWDYERFGMPYEYGGRYFFTRNDGLQNQSVLYVADALDAEPRALINPNEWSDDGTLALSGWFPTEDGRTLAYSVSSGGSDWVEFKTLDVATGKPLDDHLKWIKFSGASWVKDGRGFYYSRYDEPTEHAMADVNYYNKLYYHELGSPQSADVLVYEDRDNKERSFGSQVSDDGHYLIISVHQGTERRNRIYFQRLHGNPDETIKLLDEFDAQYSFIGNDGPLFYFFTNNNAPRGRLIAVDTNDPAPENWKELIPQAPETLRGVSLVGGRFVASYLKDAYSQIRVFDKQGGHVRDVELPGIGSSGGFSGRPDQTHTFYSFTGFTDPGAIYRYEISSGISELWKRPKVDFDPDAFETRQVFYSSKDGTRVPMFLVHRKGLTLDGTNPTYLYGYGGFNIPLTPGFSISNLVWLEMGGVYAVANLRGGGEYGKEWHDAGRLKNKQNVFDDFIAAAEFLIEQGYTRPEKLAIGGGSNGGLLVGACIVQRPELFGAAIPSVGVLDMLRFHKFTIGWAWVSDYGSPDDAEMFEVLRRYSPYHNIRPGACYPPTMIVTGDHDDRVVPSHSFKFGAALQAAQACEKPVLMRIETRAGHGAGKPTSKIIEELADRWAFLYRTLGVQARKPAG